MSDQSLLEDLEQFQELSEQEAKKVVGGKSFDVSYTSDQSLLENLEQFQELSEQEAKKLVGGKSFDVSYTKVGACPACRSGLDVKVSDQYYDIVKK